MMHLFARWDVNLFFLPSLIIKFIAFRTFNINQDFNLMTTKKQDLFSSLILHEECSCLRKNLKNKMDYTFFFLLILKIGEICNTFIIDEGLTTSSDLTLFLFESISPLLNTKCYEPHL